MVQGKTKNKIKKKTWPKEYNVEIGINLIKRTEHHLERIP